MKIYSNNNSNRLNDLVKARNAYVDELSRKKKQYDNQLESYRNRYNEFADILEAQLQGLVNDTFNQHDTHRRNQNYVNVFVRASEKRNGFNLEDFVTTYSIEITHYNNNNESRGSSENSNFKAIFDIIVDNKGNRVLKRFDNLQLYLSGSEVNYSFLKCVYEFVDKLQNINWQKTIDDIIDNSIGNNTFPIYDKEVTVYTDDTSEYDKKITIKVLGEICGKDLWVKCPFDWMKVTSMKDGVISCTIVSACGGYDSWQQVMDYCHDYDCDDISEIEIDVPIEIVTSDELKELLVTPDGSEEDDDIEDGWEDDI